MLLKDFIDQLNTWGHQNVPFLFMVDFELEKPMAWPLDQINSRELLFSFNGFSNAVKPGCSDKIIQLKKHPVLFDEYQPKFNLI